MIEFKMNPSVKEALMYCEEGSYEDFGDFHTEWGCAHPYVIYQRHSRKLRLNESEVACVMSSLDNSADLCQFHDNPKLRRAAGKIAQLLREVRHATQ